MSYCINFRCPQRENPDGLRHCQTCGTPLLVKERYRLLYPLRELDEWEPSEVFAIDDGGQSKVLKVLKKKILQPLFEREALTLQSLDHPGIPHVEPDGYFELEIGDQRLYCLVMESVQGTDLDDWQRQNPPPDQATALAWLGQLVDLLAQLHGEELFHRDIKLSNIMLRPTGELALVDFGSVRPMTATYFAKLAGRRDITSVVSPGYTPLEQINGRAVPQSDFYALGRSFVHLLTGCHPVDLPEDATTGRLSWREAAKQPLDDWFVSLLDDMMAPFPGQRPLNAETLKLRLQAPEAAAAKSGSSLLLWSERLLIGGNVALLLVQLFLGWQLLC